ncbi:MAG: diaminopimelate dehydrogenase [Eubacteriales bacterium]|jgi:diaminopimelate dehydrogenase|nr:diaminopimelate dehydrogenase [Eubacteriales bacterium]
MPDKIRIAIAGYGNLGRGVEAAVTQNPDMRLIAVLTRRDPNLLKIKTKDIPVLGSDNAAELADRVDVLIICGGSATDLPEQGPYFAGLFNTVDSYDAHADIPLYYSAMDEVSKKRGHLSLVSAGWDPGMFSLNRLYADAILPRGTGYTFWGRGVSQGHSDAIRRIKGVKNAIQYTVPIDEAMEAVRSGNQPSLGVRDKHIRVCYVVAEEDADREEITGKVVAMPKYFADYNTTVEFITDEELRNNHSRMPHGGYVIHSGKTASGANHIIEYSLKLESNPEFTGAVLTAYARAIYRLSQKGETGARTVFDIPPVLLSAKTPEELRASML